MSMRSGADRVIGRIQRELPETDRDRYDRAYELGREGNALTIAAGVVAGMLAGLLLMWLMDPELGARRRTEIGRRAEQVRAVIPSGSALTPGGSTQKDAGL